MSLHAFLISCLCGDPLDNHPHPPYPIEYRDDPPNATITEKPLLHPPPPLTFQPRNSEQEDEEEEALATKILTHILTSPPLPANTPLPLPDDITTTSFTSRLAERVLHALEATLQAADQSSWGGALQEAYNHAVELAKEELQALWEYAMEHPYEVAAQVLLTVLALGVLGRMVPALVRVLGFGLEGPVEGSFAAWWQRLYAGYVPKGSLWSFLQRMGMTWK